MKTIVLFFIIIINTGLYSQNIWEMTQYYYQDMALSIEIPDSNNCFVLVENNSYHPNKTIVYKSSNQGKSWFTLKSIDTSYVKNLSCPDSLNIWIGFINGYVYKSSDGGKNFELAILTGLYNNSSIIMYNKDIGVIVNYSILITRNGWQTYEKFSIIKNNMYFSYRNPKFINDSILYANVFDLNRNPFGMYFLKLNIYSKEYELNHIDNIDEGIRDLYIVNENLIFACGKSNTISGGSGQ